MSKIHETAEQLSEQLTEMLAEHNSAPYMEKRFYYSEEEVKRLCRHASLGNFPADTFEIWWDKVKKK